MYLRSTLPAQLHLGQPGHLNAPPSPRRIGKLLAMLSALCLAGGCEDAAEPAAKTDVVLQDAADGTAQQQAPDPTKQPAQEWVSFTVHTPLPADWDKQAASLFGASAEAGQFGTFDFAPGYHVVATADPAVPDQAWLTFSFDKQVKEAGDKPEVRTLATVPVSFATGKVWLATVQAAMAKMQADVQEQPGSGQRFLLEYQVRSTQGGSFTWSVEGNAGVYTLHVMASSPRTALAKEVIGKAIQSASAFDSIAGTVWFELSKDEFDFFVDRAYGAGAASKQNFKDFQLLPHSWLRLTVTPHLDEQFVDVGFEVITLDGKRLAVAKAPASVLAGAAFQDLVLANMQRMLAQEEEKPGSSVTWDAPFYYDEPAGGGIVRVVAHGEKGKFNIAYAVETPQRALVDVPFVAWPAVKFPDKDPTADAACNQLGDPNITLAAQGTLNMTFKPSTVIANNPKVKGKLKGTIYCSIFRASEVILSGPLEGAKSLQDFEIADADLEAATPPTFVSKLLTGGQYQTLCFHDVDGNQTDSKGDPVTLPIGGQEVACNQNPVVIEFGLLKP